MMGSGALFITVTLAFALALVLVVFRGPGRALAYFKTKEGLGVLRGVVIFIAAAVLVVWAASARSQEGEWFAFGDVFLGIDNTNKQSPMCHDGPNSSRLTSNGGLVANIYRTGDRRFEANAKYTHHSCAFNRDDASYDALGLELKYRLWGR